MQSPHDQLFHSTFAHPQHAAAWLRSVLPKALAAAFDWSTLAPADSRLEDLQLRAHVADLVFVARLRRSGELIVFLIEHKSQHDPGLEAQLLRYVVHVRRVVQRRRGDLSLHIVPVVLHHGTAPLRRRSPPAPASPAHRALLALAPRLTFLVDDLTICSEDQLRRPSLTPLAQLTLLCLRVLPRQNAAAALAAMARWAHLFRAVAAHDGHPPGDDPLDSIAWYVLAVIDVTTEDLQMALSNLVHKFQPLPGSTLDRLQRDSHAEGRTEGRSEGRSEGRTEGESHGRAEALLVWLDKRFAPVPATLVQRVRGATIQELDRWIARVVDAVSLASVFTD